MFVGTYNILSYHFCVYLKIFMIKSIFRNRKERKDSTGNILAKVTNDFLVAEHNEHGSVLMSLATVSSNS